MLTEIASPVVCVLWNAPQKAIGFKTPLEDRGKDTLEAIFKDEYIQGVKPLIINFYCQYSTYNENKDTTADNLLVFHFRRVGVLGLGKVDLHYF